MQPWMPKLNYGNVAKALRGQGQIEWGPRQQVSFFTRFSGGVRSGKGASQSTVVYIVFIYYEKYDRSHFCPIAFLFKIVEHFLTFLLHVR